MANCCDVQFMFHCCRERNEDERERGNEREENLKTVYFKDVNIMKKVVNIRFFKILLLKEKESTQETYERFFSFSCILNV